MRGYHHVRFDGRVQFDSGHVRTNRREFRNIAFLVEGSFNMLKAVGRQGVRLLSVNLDYLSRG